MFRNALSRMSKIARRFTEGIMDMNFQPRGISDLAIQGPASYQSEIEAAEALLRGKDTWNGVNAEAVARMRLQNRFKTGLDVARYTAALMRADMARYGATRGHIGIDSLQPWCDATRTERCIVNGTESD